MAASDPGGLAGFVRASQPVRRCRGLTHGIEFWLRECPGNRLFRNPEANVEPNSAPRFGIVNLPSGGMSLPKWFLDTPQDGIPYQRIGHSHFRLRGWVLPGGALRAGVAIRAVGVTRAYPLNEQRGDAMTKLLDLSPAENPDLLCGFDLKLREVDELDFGLDLDGKIVWLKRLRRLDGASAKAGG